MLKVKEEAEKQKREMLEKLTDMSKRWVSKRLPSPTPRNSRGRALSGVSPGGRSAPRSGRTPSGEVAMENIIESTQPSDIDPESPEGSVAPRGL